jgi:DNA-binding transcriptional LysR family regulator
MAFSLKQIKIFMAVAQLGSITAAAEVLCLTKPAVSMALSELESQLNQALFNRVNKKLIINAQGRGLLPLVDELLSCSNSINHFFDNTSALRGQLRVGASNTIGSQITPFLLQRFRKKTQHLEQSLYISNTADISNKIKIFELDIGLVEDKVNHTSLMSHAWLKDEMLIICAKHHPLAKKPTVQLNDLDNKEWILREKGSGTRNYFFSHIAPHLKQWHIPFELNNAAAIINCVAAGLGITCISKHCLTHVKMSAIKILPLSVTLHRQYWVIHHQDKYQDSLFQSFTDFLSEQSNKI